MLISLVERFQEDTERESFPYTAWAAALFRFRNDCQQGAVPEISDLTSFLESVPEIQRKEALTDLISAHLFHSRTQESGSLLPHYVEKIPELGPLAELPADLIEDEFLARYQIPLGDFPQLSEYLHRFPERTDLAELLQERFHAGERYVKLHRIGSGVSSIVWSAYDHDQKKMVAIKEPHHKWKENPDILRLLNKEASVTAKLQHPGIVTLTAIAGPDESASVYVMPMAGDENFSDRIQDHHRNLRQRKKSIRTRSDWRPLLGDIIRICDAMDYCHGKGLLHCDLKAGNVVCTASGEIGVIDWGMARKIQSKELSLSGTPDYMAPEQVDGIVNVRSEVFCLGAILYETLTGQAPFLWTKDGIEARPENWKALVRNGGFPPPRKVNRGIPKPLDRICRKAMARDPGERYQSAGDLAKALWTYLSDKAKRWLFRKR